MHHTPNSSPVDLASDNSSRGPARLLIADPLRVVAEALAARFRRERRVDVVGVATSPEEVTALFHEPFPQIVLLDAFFDGYGAFELCTELRRRYADVRFLFLTANDSRSALKVALELDAGFLAKSDSLDDVVAAVCGERGVQPLSAAVLGRVQYDAGRSRFVLRDHSPFSELTPRQIEVLRHLAHGRTTREIANELDLSPRGIESHKHRIMHKLEIYDRVSLARYAIREGLLPP